MKFQHAILLTALLLATACTPTDTTTIGAVLTLTGWGSYWGEPARHGVEMAEHDINQHNKTPVNVIVEDSKTSNQGALKAANKLVNVNDVDAIYSEFSGPSAAISDILQEKKKTLLYSALPTTLLRENPYALKSYFNVRKECEKLAQTAHRRGLHNQALFIVNLAFATPCKRGIQAVTNTTTSQLVYSGKFDTDATDYRTQLTNIKQSNADVIIGVFYEDHAINLLEQATELGLDTHVYCGGKNDCLTSHVLNTTPKNALKGAVTYNYDIDESFKQRYYRNHPRADEVDMQAAALAYDGIHYLYHALQHCRDATPACIVNAVQHVNYTPVVNGTGFSNDRILNMNTRLEEYTNGTFTPLTS